MRKDGYRVEQADSPEIDLGARTATEYLHSPVSQTPLEAVQEL